MELRIFKDKLWVIYPGDKKYQLTEKIWVMPLEKVASPEYD